MKKIISIFLSLLVAINIFPITVFAERNEEPSIEDIIRPQIEEYAKSIDQKDADGEAADALAYHGMFGRGKDLKVGEDHALTALLMNSELMKAYLIEACSEMLKTADDLKAKEVSDASICSWSLNGKYWYAYYIYDYHFIPTRGHGTDAMKYLDTTDYVKRFHSRDNSSFPDIFNKYDKSLEWIAGGVNADIYIVPDKIYYDKIIFNVNFVVRDVFDFTTSTGSGFGDLISGIGALLFREFEWFSMVDFQIETPNDCEHSFGEWKSEKAPTCTEKGSEERKCINCGCVETKSIEAKGHSFGEWYESKAPTYFEEGEEQRTCSSCGCVDTRAVAALDYLPGDLNGDESINVLDANLVRKYSAKSVELTEKQFAAGDVNGDGKLNVLDANLIRKYSAKLIDKFPINE